MQRLILCAASHTALRHHKWTHADTCTAPTANLHAPQIYIIILPHSDIYPLRKIYSTDRCSTKHVLVWLDSWPWFDLVWAAWPFRFHL